MEYKEITKSFSNKGTRNEVRMRVVNEFAKEEPGIGTDEQASRYRYYVEKLSDGNRIYLHRPGGLNSFDFVIYCENIYYLSEKGRKRYRPSHDDIKKSLNTKHRENESEYNKLINLLKKVYRCEDVSDDEINKIKLYKDVPNDYIVRVVKWFLIEQDIAYWNKSGRAMLGNYYGIDK